VAVPAAVVVEEKATGTMVDEEKENVVVVVVVVAAAVVVVRVGIAVVGCRWTMADIIRASMANGVLGQFVPQRLA